MVQKIKIKIIALAVTVLAVGFVVSGCEQQQAATIQIVTDEITATMSGSPSVAIATPEPEGPEESMVLDGVPDPGDEIPGEVLSHTQDYQNYKLLNPDVIGWISVPNTRIEYPVVIAADNDYYLGRNVERERSKSGAVFMDWRNADSQYQRHLVLYGHNMKNGTMFSGLNSYKQKDFFDNNQKIYFYWGDGLPIEYEVYAAFNVGIDIDFIQVAFNSDEEFLEKMNYLKDMSKFTRNPDVVLEADDQIITLTTCTYEYDNQRFVIQARKVK